MAHTHRITFENARTIAREAADMFGGHISDDSPDVISFWVRVDDAKDDGVLNDTIQPILAFLPASPFFFADVNETLHMVEFTCVNE